MSPTIVLFDGNALIHRAFHAIPPLTTGKGELVNAAYGFASMLLKVLSEVKPAYLAVAFDRATPTFRHIEFAAYKAQRPKVPDGLFEQFDRVRELVTAFGIPIYEIDGFEADDVLGTLAHQATQLGVDTVIVTGDADAMQLVDPHVRVLTPQRTFADTKLYDEAAVRERYGLEPRQLIDYKALKGDPSDNIPGVPGVGDKTAVRLLREHGSLQALYEHLDQLPEKTRNLLSQNEEIARQSQHLATIVTEVPIVLDLDACRASGYDRARVAELFRELEFRSLLPRLPGGIGEAAAPVAEEKASVPAATFVPAGPPDAPQQMSLFEAGPVAPVKPLVVSVPTPPTHGDYRLVASGEALEELANELAAAADFALDVETTGIDPMRAALVGLSFSAEPGRAYYVPVGHGPQTEGAETQLPMERVLARLRPVLSDPARPKCGHN
ncbi:MAG: 5'-3' exonuclease H3TH domain-containing protein, partial [Chloroflexota bacterium]